MLFEAKGKSISNLVNADGAKLPFKRQIFDLVYLVNSFHFFEDKQQVICGIKKVLKHSGEAVIVFADFFHPGFYWYIYDIFPEIKKLDTLRYSTSEEIKGFFESAGFSDIEYFQLQGITKNFAGEEVFSDPFIKKHNSSQLGYLTDDEYYQGIGKIKELADSGFLFRTEIIFSAITAMVK
jgi:ubiquinone/menaquinone biosynthesis C-methylase UbiE